MSTVRLVLSGRTAPQVVLCPSAVQVIQVDRPSAWGEGPVLSAHTQGVTTAQLSTHHVSVLQVPLVVTDRAPLTTTPHLHTTSAPVWTSGQTDEVVT